MDLDSDVIFDWRLLFNGDRDDSGLGEELLDGSDSDSDEVLLLEDIFLCFAKSSTELTVRETFLRSSMHDMEAAHANTALREDVR
ncbi:hypothetical protein PC116_g26620 [Phytophthora cactorum]|uniref:Uncharacterized protein n=1 Tax=Phytophthora cactorum TaxID=29920 RepID=A0A8T1C5B1_9STRA|nr:hypothetical protein PC114_g17956 [Phytophthora cactorum]KAG2917414.1 hypothetical protein PC117_g17450 [Phytophthora cactorum]KAG2967312.1 hypothetical protein PC119_g24513 [Phytophthora cactorum]KAG2984474.1 hypothetical protein PC120_g24228 [Phytophthora cactorum]KAG3145646.1 hypothetical protein C6341_g18326 [Phytophthora cactorum]